MRYRGPTNREVVVVLVVAVIVEEHAGAIGARLRQELCSEPRG